MTTPHTTLRRPHVWTWHAEPTALRVPVDADYLIGFAIVALAPALFWPLVVKAASVLVGFAVGWVALTLLGSAIFAFLGTLYALLARRR